MITTDEISKIRQQLVSKQVKQGKITTDAIANIRKQMQPVEPVTQPVQQVVTQPVQTAQQVQPQVTNHAQKAQQGYTQATNKLHETEVKATPMTDKINSGASLTPEEVIQLAKEQGKITNEEAQYQLKRANARNTPVANTYAAKENYEKAKQEPVKAVDREQGKKDAEKVNVTSENAADEYIKARANLQQAQANNDTRKIAKNEAIVEKSKQAYNGEKPNIDITSLGKQLNGLEADLDKIQSDYNLTTDIELKNKLADDYNKTLENYNAKRKIYNNAVAYDEIKNNNMANDIAESTYLGLAGGTHRMGEGAYALGSRLSNANADQINADELLRYNNNEANWTDTVQDIGNTLGKLNLQQLPVNLANRLLGNEKQTANSAYTQLQRVALLNPDNIGIQRLYRDITNHTYKGTAEDLRNELDKIQKELYQNYRDVTGADYVLGKEREQLAHNENVYGELAAIPNAFNTTANMIPSMALAPLGGENVSLAAMAVGAGGGALDEALQSGARYNQAFDYGVLSGATEFGTEKLFGSGIQRAIGINGTIDPSELANKFADSLGIKNRIGRAVLQTMGDVTGESLEEMISETLNPLWKYATYDQNAFKEFNPEQIIKAGIDAIPSTLLMEGMGAAGTSVKVDLIANGVVKSINQSKDLSPIVKNQLINEVREAAKDVKLGLEGQEDEKAYLKNKAFEKYQNLSAQSEQMKQRIPEGYSLPQSTIDILSYTENNRPGLNIAFDTNIQGNGTFVENSDGTRTITLNPNSKRAVEFTLTHELGHDLKGTGEYTQLQNLLTDYAKGKPGYQEALNQLDKTYKESGANYNLQDEATNDMLGQAIGEQEFYNKLAENPTLFNRVTNGLKNLLGNKDTKLKNKIEKLTSNALKQEYKGNDNQVRSSLGENENEVLTFKAANGDNVEIIKNPTDVMLDRFENDAKKKYASEYIGERPDNNILRRTFDNKGNVYYWAAVDMAHEPIEKFLKEKNPGYNFSQHPEQIIENYNPSENYYYRETRYSLSEAPTMDNQGRELTKEQQNFYKDASSKAKDSKGELLNLYHTTPNQFTIFDKSKIGNNTAYANTAFGFFVTPNKNFSTRFGDINEKGLSSNTMNLYTNAKNIITHPFNALDKYQGEELDNIVREYNEAVYPEVGLKYLEELLAEIRETDPNATLYDAYMAAVFDGDAFENAEEERRILEEKGYDGVEFVEGFENELVEGSTSNEPVVSLAIFNPNQIKSIDNLNPTENEDIRYSKQNASWQQFLDKNLNLAKGTKTNFLPTTEELQRAETKSVENEPIVNANKITTNKKLEDMRNFKEVGNKKVNAYQYENPEVKPFFQYEAGILLDDLNNATKGERFWQTGNGVGDGYGVESYYKVTGQKRDVVQDIADLLDGNYGVKLSYNDIRKGLEAIIEDNGAENIAAAKRIEMVLDKRLREGYKDSYGYYHEPGENYNKFLKGEEYVAPDEYDLKQLQDTYDKKDDTLFSLSDEETKEINDYIGKLNQDTTIDENFKEQVLNKFDNLNTYKQFEDIKKEVQDYKDRMYDIVPKQRKHISTLMESEIIPDEVKSKIKDDARKYYEPQSNQTTLDNAKKIIGNDYAKAEHRFLEKELNTAEDVGVADILIQKAIADGDYTKAAELSVTLAEKLTQSGQVVQAASMIKRFTPEGMLIYAEKQLNNAVDKIKEDSPKFFEKLVKDGVIEQGKGKPKINLTENEVKTITDNMEKAQKMEDGREKDVLVAKTLTLIGNKIPATVLEKVAALRRNGLLMNLKTLNRNIGSDLAFGTLENLKDVPAAALDKVVSFFTGKRTTALPNLKAAAKGFIREGKYSIQDLYYGIDTTNGEGSKYELPSKAFKRENTYKEIAQAFKNLSIKDGTKMAFKRLLSDYEDAAMFFVNGTDRPFWKARFESELANQMKLNGLKYEVDAPTKENMEIAKEAADYATFKNKNVLSSSLSQLRSTINRGKPIGLADAIGLTFTNVPGSVGSKIYDYTAGGYLKAGKQLYNAAIKNGKFSQRDFVQNLARSMTGTAGVILLSQLISKGILTGSYDDDKDKADLEREMGIQKNAINLTAFDRFLKGEDTTLKKGDKFYNFDWIQPVSGLAILGANLYKKASGGIKTEDEDAISELDDENEYYVRKKETTDVGDLAMEALATTANQIADMSSLGNFSDLFKGYEGLGGNIADIPGNFASSFIPTISNNIGQFTDETQRNTKDYTSRWNTNINKMTNKLPGARETLEPKVNTLGEEKLQYVNGNDFVSTFLNPGYYTTYNPSDIQQELMDVYNETGDATIFPSVSPGTITSQGESVRLKPKGVTTFQKASGQYASELYDALLDDEFYKSLEASEKAKVLKMVADDSRDIGKAAIGIKTKNYNKLDTDKDYLERSDIPLVDYYMAEYAYKNIAKAKTDASKEKAIRENVTTLNSDQMSTLYKIFDI